MARRSTGRMLTSPSSLLPKAGLLLPPDDPRQPTLIQSALQVAASVMLDELSLRVDDPLTALGVQEDALRAARMVIDRDDGRRDPAVTASVCWLAYADAVLDACLEAGLYGPMLGALIVAQVNEQLIEIFGADLGPASECREQ